MRETQKILTDLKNRVKLKSTGEKSKNFPVLALS
jgi:hypothetical protein